MNDNSRAIVTFTMISHAIVHTYELSIPIFVVVWLSEFPVTTGTLGTVVAVGYALFGLGALPSGVLVDRYNTKSLVLLCLAGMGASFLVLSLAQGMVSIAIALSIWGISASIHHPASLSLISTGVEERGTGFAYHGMAGNLGIAFGPLVTALLLLVVDWRVAAVALVVPAVFSVLYAFSAEFDEMAAASTDGGEDEPEPAGSFLANSRSLFTVGFTLAFFVVMMNGLFYRGTLTFLPDVLGSFLPDISEVIQLFEPGSAMAERFNLASYLYAGLLTIGIGGQYVGGKLTDRIPAPVGLAVIFGSLSLIAVVFIPTASAGVLPLVLVSALFGFFLFAVQPMYQATIAEQSPPGERGLSYGYTYLANFGVGAGGAALAGVLLGLTDAGGTFTVLALVPAAGAALAVLLWRVSDSGSGASTQ